MSEICPSCQRKFTKAGALAFWITPDGQSIQYAICPTCGTKARDTKERQRIAESAERYLAATLEAS